MKQPEQEPNPKIKPEAKMSFRDRYNIGAGDEVTGTKRNPDGTVTVTIKRQRWVSGEDITRALSAAEEEQTDAYHTYRSLMEE